MLLFPKRSMGILAVLAAIELLHAGYGNRIAVSSERVAEPPLVYGPLVAATGEANRDGLPRPRMLALGDAKPPRTVPPPNMPGFWGVEDLGAYNPLPKRRMEDFFLALEPNAEGKHSVVFGGGGAGVQGLFDPRSLDHPLLDLLGVDWILASKPVSHASLTDRTSTSSPGQARLYERSGAMPRATFLDRSRCITDRDRRLAVLASVERDPRTEVLLESTDAPEFDGDRIVDAEVSVVEHRDERVVVRVVNREPGILRLADPYDAGWVAHDEVSGEDLPVYVADHYLRAVALEPGEHRVVFRYAALSVRAPAWIGGLGLLLAIAAIVLSRPRRAVGEVERAGEAGSPGPAGSL